MPYDFSELISQYCIAKAEAANNPDDQKFAGRLDKNSRQLINAILKYGKLYPLNNKLYYQKYEELLSDVLEEVLATVCQEYDRSQSSLTTWINRIKRFQYRVIDLFPKPKKDEKYSFELGDNPPPKKQSDSQLYRKTKEGWEPKKRIQNSVENPISLNPILGGNEGGGVERIELLASENLEGLDLLIEQEGLENLKTLEEIRAVSQGEIAFTLNDLDAVVIQDQQNYRNKKNQTNSQNSWYDLWIDYLENDPDNFFKNETYKDREGNPRPECNNHVILQTILLNDLKEGAIINQAYYKTWRDKLKPLESKFNVSINTLYSSLRHSERPHTILNYCLGFAVIFGLENDTLKENIEYDGDRLLRDQELRIDKIA